MGSSEDIRIELCCCEMVLLDEIASPEMKRNDVASTYGLAIRSGEPVDWAKVNRAIIERWSKSALVYIKERAWKLLDAEIVPPAQPEQPGEEA